MPYFEEDLLRFLMIPYSHNFFPDLSHWVPLGLNRLCIQYNISNRAIEETIAHGYRYNKKLPFDLRGADMGEVVPDIPRLERTIGIFYRIRPSL